MWEEGKYYFEAPISYDEKTIRKKWKEETPKYMSELKDRLAGLSDISSEKIIFHKDSIILILKF